MIDTLSGVTQWDRPGGDAFVIPLGLIQVSSATILAIDVESSSHEGTS
jgi:hypothetical protein